MTAQIINGKEIAATLREELKNKIEHNTSSTQPTLAVVLVGDNEASRIYVNNKQKAAAQVGINCEVMEFAASIGENALLDIIDDLNANNHIHGIIVQLPLPEHIDSLKVLSRISPTKDVDGFNPESTGLLSYNNPQGFVSATPKGILHLLRQSKIELSGKHAVIIGRSNIVGKPMAMLLLNNDCTVTVTHSKTKNIKDITRTADIVIAACGQAKMIKADWLKKGAVVIDVGINKQEGKLCGDVDFDDAKTAASFITPVPGGVGPMTVAMLLQNTYEAFCRNNASSSCRCHNKKCCCH